MNRPRVENFGPSLPAAKYRIWKLPPDYFKSLGVLEQFVERRDWCLTIFIGTYRFKDWDSAV